MKPTRLEELYRRPLARPEDSPRQLPLEHILQQSVTFYPEKASQHDFDIVEIGPGTGDFLFYLSLQHPDKKILGIEIGHKRFNKIRARLQQGMGHNISLMLGDARIPFHKTLRDETLEKCFVLFPDPWPKNRHRHLRLLQVDFLKIVCQKLKTDGAFTLATDVQDYALWVLNNFSEIPGMKNEFGDGKVLSELDDMIPTFFQKKWEKLGRSFWFLRFRKFGS